MRVSAVMPTTIARRAWIPHAVACFLTQDYAERELIVASEDIDVTALLPDDPRIRFVTVPRGLTLGAKRNLANAAAGGELIAHWDDDDWHAPGRLSTQVNALRGGARLSGVRELLFVDITTGAVWRYRALPDEPSVPGTTLCYERALWAAHPFASVRSGEERLWCIAHGASIAEPTQTIVVATVHSGNTCARLFNPPCWSHVDVNELPEACRLWLAGIRSRG